MEFSLKKIDLLPNQVGVYAFKNHRKYLYIGKSINIKARVKSHIESAKTNPKEKAIISKSRSIQFYLTENEFQAAVLEARLIKEYLPYYNTRWKDNKSFLYINITFSEEYPKIFLSRANEKDNRNLYFGPFSSVKKTENILRTLRKIVPFCTQKKLGEKACFYSKIGLCNPCPSMIEKLENKLMKKKLKAVYKNNIRLIIKLLNGKLNSVLYFLEKKLRKLLDLQNYEEAKITKKQIDNLKQLLKRKFIDSDKIIEEIKENSLNKLYQILSKYFSIKSLERIEAFDISNLGGKFAAGSMIVLTNGNFDKNQYRRFKINNEINDLKMVEELITRRLAIKDLKLPDLIIIDGGEPQLRVIKSILKNKKVSIPLIGIAKNPDRIILGLENYPTISIDYNNSGFNLLKLIRDTAHQFAINYHKLLFNKNYFKN